MTTEASWEAKWATGQWNNTHQVKKKKKRKLPTYNFEGWEDPLEEAMATHSSGLAWEICGHWEAQQASVHGVTKNWTQLWNFIILDTSINILQKLNNKKKILQKWRQKKVFFWYTKGEIIHHQQAHTIRNVESSRQKENAIRQNMDLHRGMQSTKSGNYMSQYIRFFPNYLNV